MLCRVDCLPIRLLSLVGRDCLQSHHLVSYVNPERILGLEASFWLRATHPAGTGPAQLSVTTAHRWG